MADIITLYRQACRYWHDALLLTQKHIALYKTQPAEYWGFTQREFQIYLAIYERSMTMERECLESVRRNLRMVDPA
jgi:hypothetical protein